MKNLIVTINGPMLVVKRLMVNMSKDPAIELIALASRLEYKTRTAEVTFETKELT